MTLRCAGISPNGKGAGGILDDRLESLAEHLELYPDGFFRRKEIDRNLW